MAKQKPSPQKKKKPNPKKKDESLKTNLKRSLAGLLLLLAIVVLSGVVAHVLLKPGKPVPPAKKSAAAPGFKFEIYPEVDVVPRKRVPKPWPGLPEELPRVAIIIDDIGFDRSLAEKFLELDAKLTYSVLPHTSFSKAFAQKVRNRGLDLMLHLPMEPNEYPEVDPGSGALLTTMSPDDLIDQLKKNLEALPGIKGVNNHMGSKMTAVSSRMYQIFSILKQRDLYFIDSRTSHETLCRPSARMFKIPFAQRDVFIDHVLEAEMIRKQLATLVQIAQDHGEAVGIAHPHAVTFEVLREVLPELQKKVQLVPASQVVRIIG